MAAAADAPMQRVLVSGISGAGKSTLARRVAAARGLPYHELDALHHGAGWVKRPSFEADVEAIATSERWITEDQYASFLGSLLWERADTVLWLDMPRSVVMRRVVVRTFARLLLRRELWNGNRERWRDLPTAEHPIRWAWSQHAARRLHVEAQGAAHPGVRVVRLRSQREVDEWFAGLDRLRVEQ
jgi:adenylate kinase family enzyme